MKGYVEEAREVALEFGISLESAVGLLQLRRLDSISSQLYHQSYHRGYEAPPEGSRPSTNVDLKPLSPPSGWQSPATSARLAD